MVNKGGVFYKYLQFRVHFFNGQKSYKPPRWTYKLHVTFFRVHNLKSILFEDFRSEKNRFL